MAEPIGERIAAMRAAAAERAEAGDIEGAVREYEADLALQPGHVGLLGQLALFEAQRGDADAAAARLEQIAETGATLNVAALVDGLGALASEPRIAAALARVEANAAPAGEAEIVAEVNAPDALVEGVAIAANGDMFVSTIVGRSILVSRGGGDFEVFADRNDGLFSVAGIGVDEANGLVWAATRVFPITPLGPDETASTALVAFDAETGAVRARAVPAEADAALADMTVAPDGDVYVSDPDGGRIYRVTGVDGELEVLVASDEFMSLQGLAVLGGRLYAADYGRGLFAIDLETRAVSAVAAPDDASLIGIDGLAATPDGALIAVQNGFRPNRVVRLDLSEAGDRVTAVEVLAAGLPAFDEPTLGQVVGDRFVFVANSQWGRFPESGDAPAREPTRLMAAPLSR